MEVAVHLAQPVFSVVDLPAPPDAFLFNFLQNPRKRSRIAVIHAEDALAVADQFADAARVEPGIAPPQLVDFHEVVAQSIAS